MHAWPKLPLEPERELVRTRQRVVARQNLVRLKIARLRLDSR